MTSATAVLTIDDLLSQAGWARRLAAGIVRDEALADDLLQETWIAALRARPAADRPIRPWLGRVLRNLAFNRERGVRRRDAREAEVVTSTEFESPSPEDLLARLEIHRLLASVVADLEEPIRQTVLLRYFEGLSGADIARQLGIPAGTVRWRLKTGLDQIRAGLDGRHAGDRKEWMRAILPFLPDGPVRPAAVSHSAGAPAILVGAAAFLLTGAVWFARRQDRDPAILLGSAALSVDLGPAVAAAPPSSTPAGSAPGDALVGSAPSETKLDECRARLARVRKEAVAIEKEWLRVADVQTLYRGGRDNPAARAALLPHVTRILKAEREPSPALNLECRTWACRMTVLVPAGGDEPHWMRPLQQEPDMMSRTIGIRFGPKRFTRDPASGISYDEILMHLKLTDPTGRPAGRATVPQPPPETYRASVTLAVCRAEIQARAAHIRSMREDIDSGLTPKDRFGRARPNPALTAEIAAEAKRRLGGESAPADLRVECRGQICLVGSLSEAQRDPNGPIRLDNDPAFRERLTATLSGFDESYYAIRPADVASGLAIARKVFAALEASATLAVCHSRFPASGRLDVKLRVSDSTRPRNDEESPEPIFAEYSSALVGTPLGRCVADAVTSHIAATALPQKYAAASYIKRFDFPPRAPPNPSQVDFPHPGLGAGR